MRRGIRDPGSLRDAGEFGFIELVRRRFGGAVRPGEAGIGDDAALVRPPAGKLAISTDLLVEGTHFDLRHVRAGELGWKALSANLSDLAAMGAHPLWYFVALAAPPDTPVARLMAMFGGMARAAKPSGIRLMGGDTCRGDRLVLSLTVAGNVPRGKAARRKGARPGDLLFVTGAPGWSSLGLEMLSRGRPRNPAGWRREAMRRHVMPEARWREGIAAARCGAVSAMIDVSDGILSDLSHLLAAGGAGAVLDERAFRYPKRFREGARALGVDPLEAFLAGGEDYELLMAVRPHRYEAFRRAARLFPAGAFPIGVVTNSPGIRVRRADGSWMSGDALPGGFAHFPSFVAASAAASEGKSSSAPASRGGASEGGSSAVSRPSGSAARRRPR
ncbi:MAG: thiamine-phosphate kinase [Deltaproteobacteria bacterium]|nr:thiamine-phosphate kinase [Deltaproteobacteria bacterium]